MDACCFLDWILHQCTCILLLQKMTEARMNTVQCAKWRSRIERQSDTEAKKGPRRGAFLWRQHRSTKQTATRVYGVRTACTKNFEGFWKGGSGCPQFTQRWRQPVLRCLSGTQILHGFNSIFRCIWSFEVFNRKLLETSKHLSSFPVCNQLCL